MDFSVLEVPRGWYYMGQQWELCLDSWLAWPSCCLSQPVPSTCVLSICMAHFSFRAFLAVLPFPLLLMSSSTAEKGSEKKKRGLGGGHTWVNPSIPPSHCPALWWLTKDFCQNSKSQNVPDRNGKWCQEARTDVFLQNRENQGDDFPSIAFAPSPLVLDGANRN